MSVLPSDDYIIRNVAFEGSVGTLHSSGESPRPVAMFPPSEIATKVEVSNHGGLYNIKVTGTDTAVIDGKVFGIFRGTSEKWALEYQPQYDAYIVQATSQNGAWTVPNGGSHTQVAVAPIDASPDVYKTFLFTFEGPHRGA
ncbi:hypothetical protein SERLA73DRAFT_187258 [Serpula lacrymans var. lacrymans S7.3]|uniref:Uncharacterized protein n=2 Tax=Serpula lacrymans var. lacrymans TaxID=341189 RepID=F8Q8R9_SERL3|nr:uncharacterized protein SERLADRAFT_476697 [Serpula lacrymans var. lacrymans S7.9]EGN94974.1 hypothetical protein SERLA73DRAFT_187258 [Serpula lacrymans var. lacrymans S7.3]EGO20465.1 hypothetical protein SERLADRAFT_476697 [Serpula lacrymans var. lacrymans S7.9]